MSHRRILVIESPDDMRRWVANTNGRVGLVPTMGALHDGHLSLARQSVSDCEQTVATIFVNPTQFSPDEDLDEYPRTLEEDLNQLDALGVEVAFAPSIAAMYPEGEECTVDPPAIASRWEGANRPTHFRGVCTVVEKLFRMIPADVAYFGQKDFQQTRVIMAMVKQLNIPIELKICPIVRDHSGLALSSRNQYLTDGQKSLASNIHKALCEARDQAADTDMLPSAIAQAAESKLKDAGIKQIDYVAVVDADTMEPLNRWSGQAVMVIAAHVGTTRLIDNMFLRS